MKKICAVHLLNDYSGSPFVFRQALEALQKDGFQIALHTATAARGGFLSNLPQATYQELNYRHSSNKWATLLRFMLVQWQLFWRLLFGLHKGELVYINTLLPAGAALAARLRGCTVVYHIHEVSISPSILRGVLAKIVAITAQDVVFVSGYVARQYRFPRQRIHTVYNALSQSFATQAAQVISPNLNTPFTVLMLCSLKAYKGVYEFIELAKQLPQIRFHLVLNAESDQVQQFATENALPANCTLFSSTNNTLPFYEQAHLVLNLSNPDEWIETFGLTLLEGMSCGRPVIAPPVGGPVELVTHGIEGFCIDSRNLPALVQAIQQLHSDVKLYMRFSENARKKAAAFTLDAFDAAIRSIFISAASLPVNTTIGKPFPKMENGFPKSLH